MNFEQAATLLNAVNAQVTGNTGITPTDTSGFVSLATTTLQAGYDPVLNAISQIVGRTIFSIRPYSRKFAGLQVDNQRFGAITRKLSIADKDFENDVSFELVDGQSVDHYKVNKPEILQTNFYGANVFKKSYTVFKDQLDNAFSGPEQFGEFMSMVTSNASDMIEQAHESLARATVANAIGGIKAGSAEAPERIVHLLSEYNALTGLSLTATTVYQPANFKAFMQFVYSRVAEISQMMSERTSLYQTKITGKNIIRHTPVDRQKVYLYAPARYQYEMMAIADTYHDNYLRMADTETVNFWQSAQSKDQISVTPNYLDSSGAIVTGTAQTLSKVFGIMFDDEFMGYTVVNQWTATTPINADGGYWNVFHHFTDRYWTDYTEKAVVLILD
jgi:hypothetical protein